MGKHEAYPARTIAVPAGHAAYIYPVAISDSTDDDATRIMDWLENHPVRGAGAQVRELLDNDEDG